MSALHIDRQVPLAPHTTLELGGPAEHFAVVAERSALVPALEWAAEKQLAVSVLGGGSNVIVHDDGVRGLTLKLATRGVRFEDAGSEVLVSVEAGENWDALVAQCVARGLGGVECLSGIPGSAGAGPLQNIGAYGQELSQCVRAVEVLDRASLRSSWLQAEACAFAYRHSRFKAEPERELVLSVQLALPKAAGACLRYAEVAKVFAAHSGAPSLAEVRHAVLQLRRGKSMLLDPQDPNRRSVGSFFLNPIVSASEAERIAQLGPGAPLPRYPQADGRVKLSAAWLIEQSGTHKGERHGHVGVSTRHSLALVHHGGGSSRELLALAELLGKRVRAAFGVELALEPVCLGFPR
jgi:UDP-N-acetylmuramate dehydrogenase